MAKAALLVVTLYFPNHHKRISLEPDKSKQKNTYNTFSAVVTFAVLAVEPALGHLPEVIFVQELAVVALLAESSEPMFADDCF
jgi:hypothetical protein